VPSGPNEARSDWLKRIGSPGVSRLLGSPGSRAGGPGGKPKRILLPSSSRTCGRVTSGSIPEVMSRLSTPLPLPSR